MSEFAKLSRPELEGLQEKLRTRYRQFQTKGLTLDMTRGKPSPEQLDLANDMLALPGADHFRDDQGTDLRNYGGLDGLPAMKQIFADLISVAPEHIIVGGNSSLALMHDVILRAMLSGVPGGQGPWREISNLAFLCPCPGYDRHFAICEMLGIRMITLPMLPTGPDMDAVEQHLRDDSAIRGIWIVPKYSNPTGITCNAATVKRLAEMKAAPDFRIFWDNAYCVHDLQEPGDDLADLMQACISAGNTERPIMFASTSKISFAGSGIAAMALGPESRKQAIDLASKQTIGPDKINQWRHVQFFQDAAGVRAHMRRHAELLRPRFAAVQDVFEKELGGRGVATWTQPRGGYFVSLDVMPGCAREVVRLAGEAGVKLTAAGATYPGGQDPEDQNLRIAPSLPGAEEIKIAMEVVSVCVKLAAIGRILKTN